jgi:hypothetical protein
MEKRNLDLKEIKSILWKYISKTGTLITNGNIDYVLEQAFIQEFGEM